MNKLIGFISNIMNRKQTILSRFVYVLIGLFVLYTPVNFFHMSDILNDIYKMNFFVITFMCAMIILIVCVIILLFIILFLLIINIIVWVLTSDWLNFDNAFNFSIFIIISPIIFFVNLLFAKKVTDND